MTAAKCMSAMSSEMPPHPHGFDPFRSHSVYSSNWLPSSGCKVLTCFVNHCVPQFSCEVRLVAASLRNNVLWIPQRSSTSAQVAYVDNLDRSFDDCRSELSFVLFDCSLAQPWRRCCLWYALPFCGWCTSQPGRLVQDSPFVSHEVVDSPPDLSGVELSFASWLHQQPTWE